MIKHSFNCCVYLIIGSDIDRRTDKRKEEKDVGLFWGCRLRSLASKPVHPGGAKGP